MSSFNTYIVLFFYYGFLYYHYNMINSFDKECLYILGAYPGVDIITMIYSVIAISRVKKVKFDFLKKRRYKTKIEETKERLKDILYLPIEFENEIVEEEDD